VWGQLNKHINIQGYYHYKMLASLHLPVIDKAVEPTGELPLQEVSVTTPSVRRGKAPPVEPYTGENPDILWEEWLV